MLFWFVLTTALSLAKTQTCRNVGATCASCTSLSICVSINSSAVVANCSRPTPYCNAGSCSPVPGSKECAQNFTSFACPEEDGTYPDGSSCHMYHVCLNGTAHNFTCTVNNSVYSPGTGSCVRQTPMRTCHRVNCKNSSAYAVYPGDHTLFYLCVNSKPTLVLRCAKGLRFDQALQRCVTNCEKEGKLADPSGNRTSFVECTMTGPATFAAVRRTCPANSRFNATILQCVLPQSDPMPMTTPSPMTSQEMAGPSTRLIMHGSVRGYGHGN